MLLALGERPRLGPPLSGGRSAPIRRCSTRRIALLETFGLEDQALAAGHDAALRPPAAGRVRAGARPRGPRCCCSTSPQPACPRPRATSSSTRSRRCPATIAVLIIEHDMDLVFRFAHADHGDGSGAILAEGRPRRSPPTCACARSISAGRAMAEPALELQRLTAGYGDTIVLEGLTLALGQGESLELLGRNGVGKTTLIATIMGHTTCTRGSDPLRRPRHRPLAALAAGARGPRLRAAAARDLPLAQVHEHLRIAARPGRLDDRAGLPAFPALAERRQPPRPRALRRRAADAGDRPRAGRQPPPAAAGRADRGPRADHRRAP